MHILESIQSGSGRQKYVAVLNWISFFAHAVVVYRTWCWHISATLYAYQFHNIVITTFFCWYSCCQWFSFISTLSERTPLFVHNFFFCSSVQSALYSITFCTIFDIKNNKRCDKFSCNSIQCHIQDHVLHNCYFLHIQLSKFIWNTAIYIFSEMEETKNITNNISILF